MNSKVVSNLIHRQGQTSLKAGEAAQAIASQVVPLSANSFQPAIVPKKPILRGRSHSGLERPGDPLVKTHKITPGEIDPAMQKAATGLGTMAGGLRSVQTGLKIGNKVGQTLQSGQVIPQIAQTPQHVVGAVSKLKTGGTPSPKPPGITPPPPAGTTPPKPPGTPPPSEKPSTAPATPTAPTTPPSPTVPHATAPQPPSSPTPSTASPPKPPTSSIPSTTIKGFAVVPGSGGHITILDDPCNPRGELLRKSFFFSGGDLFTSNNCNRFMGSPYEAQAMELEAEELKCRAECEELPDSFNLDPESKEAKMWKKQHEKRRKIRADWFRLGADLFQWRAQKLRKLDKMQKSTVVAVKGEDLNKGLISMRCVSGDDGMMEMLSFFEGTPWQAQVLSLLASDAEVTAKLRELPHGKFQGGVYVDPLQDKREKLREQSRKIEADFYRLQAKVLQWQAKELRGNSKIQKSLESEALNVNNVLRKSSFYNDLHKLMRPFCGTPFHAQALECLAREQELEAKLTELPMPDWRHGIRIDPYENERDKLQEKQGKCRAELLRLQKKVLEWRASELRKYDKTQKSFSGLDTSPETLQQELQKHLGYLEGVEEFLKGHMGFEAVKQAAAAGGASNPAAVAAAIGRKKYGKGEFQEMAASGHTAPERAAALQRKGKKAEAKKLREKIKGE